MTKIHNNKLISIFLLVFLSFGIVSNIGDFKSESQIENIDQNLDFIPIASEFDDANAVIVSYFENNIEDTHSHSATSKNIHFSSSAIEGDYSIVLDDKTDYSRWYDSTNYNQGTIECMLIPGNNIEDDSYLLRIMTIYDTLGNGVGGIHYYQGKIIGILYDGDDWATPITYTMSLNSGELYHLAFTFGLLGTHLYVNGVEVSSSVDTNILSSNSLITSSSS